MLINNRYRVMKTLGEGGFGQAYLAEDTQMPSGRQCVLKQLKPVATSPEVYQIVQDRFQREAATLEKLGENHPQIPRLYAYFSENKQFYLVQEWIEGQTLSALMETQGPQSESRVRAILMALLPVLDFIHSQGIIHRDIKPDNIILRASLSAEESQPVLIDFGAVRETMGTRVNSHNSLTSSIVIGTPGYMAAEQAAGRPIPSSDLYSLGLVAIYLLTGLPPQALESDPQTGEIIWRDQAGHVSPSLVSVVARAMRSHPRDRYSSANQMLAALSAIGPFASVSNTQPATQPFAGSVPLSFPNAVPSPSTFKTVAVTPHQANTQPQQSSTYQQNQQNQQAVAANNAEFGSDNSSFNRSENSLSSEPASQKALAPLKMGLIAAAVGAGVIGGGLFISNSVGDSTLQSTANGSTQQADQEKTKRSVALESSQGDSQRELELTYESEANAATDSATESATENESATEDESAADADTSATKETLDISPANGQSATLRQDLGLSQVDVYAVPDATTERLHYGLPGDRVTLLQQTQNNGITWNWVRFDSGAEGWISDDFLKRETAAAANKSSNNASANADSTPCQGMYYQVQDPQDTSANLRQSPEGQVITAVPNGTAVQFLGVEGSWTQVKLDSGQVGYIFTQLLSESGCF